MKDEREMKDENLIKKHIRDYLEFTIDFLGSTSEMLNQQAINAMVSNNTGNEFRCAWKKVTCPFESRNINLMFEEE